MSACVEGMMGYGMAACAATPAGKIVGGHGGTDWWAMNSARKKTYDQGNVLGHGAGEAKKPTRVLF